jgi:hypothetical protein
LEQILSLYSAKLSEFHYVVRDTAAAPLTREIDLSQIAGIVIFSVTPRAVAAFWLLKVQMQ